jgi:HTH-type transcriptional regulator/antitoxin HipB
MSTNDDIWAKEDIMRIRTPADLGALIRDSRTKVCLDQKSLADKVGVSRQWIVEVEKGKPRAEIGLLLRTIGALGIALDAEKEGPGKPRDTDLSHGVDAQVDIDSIIESARKPRK